MNTKLTNEVKRPASKFNTRDMVLKSRSGQNEHKNNTKNKSKVDTRFIPKFTPRRSYVSVEGLTKSRIAL